MGDILYWLAGGACAVTALILLFGVGGFGTGKITPAGQNKLMRMRIGAQFVAVILIVLAALALRSGG